MKFRLLTIQFFIFASIMVATVLAVYVFLFLDIRDKNREVFLILNEADIEAREDLRLRSIQDVVNDTEEQRGQLNVYFVDDDKIVEFIETIEELGSFTGAEVEVTAVNIEEKVGESGENDEFLQLTFSAKGDWDEVFYLFSLVELLPYKIEVRRASFESSSSKGKLGVWSGTFNISVAKTKSN